MSDFLTRLAQLTRGEAAVVSPRLPGRFSPLPGTGIAEAVDGGVEQQSEAGTAKESTGGVFTQQRGREAPWPDGSIERPKDQPIDAESGRREPGLQRTQPQSDEVDRMADHSPIIPVTMTSAVQKPESPAHRDLLADTGRPLESGRKQPVPVGAENDTPITGVEKIDQPDGLPEISLSGRSSLLVSSHQYQMAGPQQVLFQQPATTQPATEQQTSVHINIGRVDVRAHTAAPKPPPRISKPRSPSSQSLQDYLKDGRSRAGRS